MKIKSASAYRLEIYDEAQVSQTPEDTSFQYWLAQTLSDHMSESEVCLTLVSEDKIRKLNHQYRFNDKPTNVLSFPNTAPDLLDDTSVMSCLGDIILCPSVVIKEANEEKKSVSSHFAHIFIHGILHLLGYDHVEDEDAQIMESIEIEILQQLGISNPYDQTARD